MTVHFFKFACTAVLTATLMAACGGGGGDPPATVSPPVDLTFALKAGYQSRIVSGVTENFNVVDNKDACVSTATIATAAAVPSTFERVPGVSSAQVTTINFANCSLAAKTTTSTNFYNDKYLPIGLSAGGEYAKFEAPPTDIPALVKVGQTEIIATLITYTDSTFSVPTGKRVISYEIKADTDPSKAIVKIVTRIYDKANLGSTETLTYSMAQNGSLALTLFEVQLGSDRRLVLTPMPK